MTSNLNKMVKISLLTGIAFILMFIEFPVIPIFPWLKMDISDVPALMGAFAFGPLAGVLIEFLKVTMNFLLSGSSTGGVGEVANFIIGASFVAPAAFIYWRNKSKKSAVLGMIFGIIIMEVVAIIANVYFLLPVYGMNMAPAELMQYVTVGLLPFNGIKGIVISVLTYAIYKKVSVSIFKVEPNFGSNSKGKIA
ncbi:ECF transporter S component [Clostridium sardiniense]|uniref:ECF transporter S component n=1 Tax=Clostridium sardiniense TaxID=29369 RepID=UPI003D32CE1C